MREFIEHTSTNIIKRILKDPAHPLTVKLTKSQVRETRGASFPFETSKARTEEYNNSVVPWCIRNLRDGTACLYNPFTIKQGMVRRRRKAVKQQPARTTAAPKVACTRCLRLFEATRGIKIHQSRCKGAPN